TYGSTPPQLPLACCHQIVRYSSATPPVSYSLCYHPVETPAIRAIHYSVCQYLSSR
ncbi:unnamed protein product, partial [Closterium sp. Naga37s-1]